jgi:hypothetical protein
MRKDLATRTGRLRRVAEQSSRHHEAMPNWGQAAEVDGGLGRRTVTAYVQRIAEFDVENRQLRRETFSNTGDLLPLTA